MGSDEGKDAARRSPMAVVTATVMALVIIGTILASATSAEARPISSYGAQSPNDWMWGDTNYCTHTTSVTSGLTGSRIAYFKGATWINKGSYLVHRHKVRIIQNPYGSGDNDKNWWIAYVDCGR